jgi:hypothetical protein
MAPLPPPISSTSTSSGSPCNAQGSTTRLANARQPVPRQNADSNRDIAGIVAASSHVR